MIRTVSKRLLGAATALTAAALIGATTAQADTPVRGGTLTVGVPVRLQDHEPDVLGAVHRTPGPLPGLQHPHQARSGLLHQSGARGELERGGRRQAHRLPPPQEREVPRRDRLRCLGGEVEHRAAARRGGRLTAAQAAPAGGRLGQRARHPHRRVQAERPVPRADGHARTAGRIHGLPRGGREARRGARLEPGRHRALHLQGVGARQPHHRRAQSGLLGGGASPPRPHRVQGHFGSGGRNSAAQDRGDRLRRTALAERHPRHRGQR